MPHITPLRHSNVQQANVFKSAINAIILDYLVTSGFAGAAEKFLEEASLSTEQAIDFERIKARVEIRDLIYTGKIEQAIEGINNINAEVCTSLVPLV